MTGTSVDECMRLVADGERRRVLAYLHPRPARTVSVDEVATSLRKRQPLGAGGAQDAQRVRIRLVHAHLPKLDAHGIIEWDRHADTVRYVGNEAVEAALDHLVEPAPPGDS